MNKISLMFFFLFVLNHNPKKVAFLFRHLSDSDLAEISQTKVML